MFAGSKTVSSERNDYIMKATGIVRRIDDLGRVVIPKEIRRTMRIREGTPLEIYTSVDGEVIFRKYSPVGEISGTADQYADVLYKVGGMPTVICDRDHVIAASGIQKKEVLERRVSSSLEDLIEQRKSLYHCQSSPCKGAASKYDPAFVPTPPIPLLSGRLRPVRCGTCRNAKTGRYRAEWGKYRGNRCRIWR